MYDFPKDYIGKDVTADFNFGPGIGSGYVIIGDKRLFVAFEYPTDRENPGQEVTDILADNQHFISCCCREREIFRVPNNVGYNIVILGDC